MKGLYQSDLGNHEIQSLFILKGIIRSEYISVDIKSRTL